MNFSKEAIVDEMMGFFKSKVITSAFELNIFDAISDKPLTLDEVCRHCNIPVNSGKRLLIALTAMGLIENKDNHYLLNSSAKSYLVSDSKEWLGWLARHIDSFLYPLWAQTANAVKDDSDQRKVVFGDARSWFDILYQNPQDVVDFQEFLGIFAQPFIDGMIEAFDFSKYRHFLDIGSGIGSLPVAVAQNSPNLKISICELPQAASYLRDRLKVTKGGEDIEVITGNIIEGKLPDNTYDLVHLGWMLHDYSPSIQCEILKNIYDSLPSGATFIASETPLNDDESGPLFTALLSINMLVSTDGGVESTREEYLQRFNEVGFVNTRVLTINGPRTLFIGEKE
ncbi:methyltransferase [Zooshikella marina]|uniref:methyltransferase n=1 Tax=Zooshikella ganghwensis TaxID=202772 RepID=UPI001BB08C22|nr:methyltransferase [Zooshikella ganghwensis]MBU2704938.1 methyltransferase [Zooshikella ganghwensis]